MYPGPFFISSFKKVDRRANMVLVLLFGAFIDTRCNAPFHVVEKALFWPLHKCSPSTCLIRHPSKTFPLTTVL